MEKTFKINLPIYALIVVTTILGTLVFMNWTANGGLANLVELIYNQNQIKTFSQQLKIVVNTAYYFSLLSMSFYAVGQVYRLFKKKDDNDLTEPPFTVTTNQALSAGFHIFFAFTAFFYFLLNNDGDDLNKKYINLLPFWFLTSFIVYMLGAWFSRLAQLQLNISGEIMMLILSILILGQIYSEGFIHLVLNL